MAFQWEKFLELSERLINSQLDKEDISRTSVSRAYYAAYHNAERIAGLFFLTELQISKQLIPTKHAALIDCFKNVPDVDIQRIGRDLDRLRKDRQHADYKNFNEMTKNKAEQSVILARQTFDDLNDWEGRHPYNP